MVVHNDRVSYAGSCNSTLLVQQQYSNGLLVGMHTVLSTYLNV